MSSTPAPVATDAAGAEPEEEHEHNQREEPENLQQDQGDYEQNGEWASNNQTILLATLFKHGRKELSSGDPGVRFVHLAVLAFDHQETRAGSTGPRDLRIVNHFKQSASCSARLTLVTLLVGKMFNM